MLRSVGYGIAGLLIGAIGSFYVVGTIGDIVTGPDQWGNHWGGIWGLYAVPIGSIIGLAVGIYAGGQFKKMASDNSSKVSKGHITFAAVAVLMAIFGLYYFYL